jgi:hypothetical protein
MAPAPTAAVPGTECLSRSTPRQGDFPQPKSKHTPSVVAISERRRAEFWKNGAILICLSALGLAYLTIRASRSAELIHVMDPLGNMYAGPVEPLADSARFFDVTALYATNAALQRSSAGFDLFELLNLYYSPRAIAKLQEDQKRRHDDIRRRNLQWKPIIDAIGAPVPAGSSRIVEIRGRVVIAGAYANRSFYDEPAFVLVLTLIRNPDLGKSGAYPWICNDVDLRLATVDGARR